MTDAAGEQRVEEIRDALDQFGHAYNRLVADVQRLTAEVAKLQEENARPCCHKEEMLNAAADRVRALEEALQKIATIAITYQPAEKRIGRIIAVYRAALTPPTPRP